MLAGLCRHALGSAAQVGAIERIASLWCHLLPAIAIPAVILALDSALLPPGMAGTADHLDEPGNLLAPSGGTKPADTNAGTPRR